MAVKFGIRNVSRVGNDVTFTVFALNADDSIDTTYIGSFTFGYSNMTGVAGYSFVAADSGQRTFTATVTNPASHANLDTNFPGNDTGANLFFFGPSGGNAIFFNTGNHYVVGGTGGDFVNGNAGSDIIFGNDGNDLISAAAGNDMLDGGAGNDDLRGGNGDDMIDGGNGNDMMEGGLNNDIYVVDALGDTVIEVSNQGTDLVRTTLAAYTLTANVENLTYTGSETFNGRGNGLNNVIIGGGQADRLVGKAGDDILNGGNGSDFLSGDAGSDRLNGGDGDDMLVISDLDDIVNGDAGIDTALIVTGMMLIALGVDVEWAENQSGDNCTLFMNDLDNQYAGSSGRDVNHALGGNDFIDGRGGNDALYGGDGIDRLFGMAGNDELEGGEGNDFLEGGIDNDTLSGNGGNDVIYGEDGDDRLTGGTGKDILIGGAGADIFAFVSADDSAAGLDDADNIRDWAAGDRIDLSAIDALPGGDDDEFVFRGSGPFNNLAGEVRAEVIYGNTYVLIDMDGDSIADWVIRIEGVVTLTEGDFIL